MLKHESPSGRISPVEILRRAALVLEDSAFTPAEARVGARLVLYTNSKRGFAYPGQRRLRRVCHTGKKTVASAIGKLVERGHIRPAGIGPHGVTYYRPEPVGGKSAPSPVPPVGALNDSPASPPDRDTNHPAASLPDGDASPAPASLSASLPASLPERASVPLHRDETDNITGEVQRELEREELNGDGPSLSPCAALSQEDTNGNDTATANGHSERRDFRETENGNDHDTTADRERLIALAYPGGATAKQRAALVTPLAVAERTGVPLPFVAHALTSGKAGLPAEPWKRIDHVIAKAQQIVEGFNREEMQERERAGTEPLPLARTLGDVIARGLAEQWPDGKQLRGGLNYWTWRSIRRQCTEWPESGADDYGAEEKPARRTYRASVRREA